MPFPILRSTPPPKFAMKLVDDVSTRLPMSGSSRVEIHAGMAEPDAEYRIGRQGSVREVIQHVAREADKIRVDLERPVGLARRKRAELAFERDPRASQLYAPATPKAPVALSTSPLNAKPMNGVTVHLPGVSAGDPAEGAGCALATGAR